MNTHPRCPIRRNRWRPSDRGNDTMPARSSASSNEVLSLYPTKDFECRAQGIEVEQRQQVIGAVAAACADYGVHVVTPPQLRQSCCARLGTAGEISLALQRNRRGLDLPAAQRAQRVAACFQRGALNATGKADHADRAALAPRLEDACRTEALTPWFDVKRKQLEEEFSVADKACRAFEHQRSARLPLHPLNSSRRNHGQLLGTLPRRDGGSSAKPRFPFLTIGSRPRRVHRCES